MKATTTPAGLAMMFSMLREDSETAFAPAQNAGKGGAR